MAIKVRCNQCRLVLSGKRQGNKHAEETGHVWKPGYQCTHCGAAYMKRRECRGHATCSSGPAPYPAPLLAKFATQPVAETSDARATSPYWSWATFQEQMQSSLHRDRSATSATYSPMAPHFLSSGVPISQLVKCSQCHEHFRDAIVLQNHLQIAHSGSHCGPRSQTCSTDGAAHEGCHPLAVGVLTIKEDEAAAPSALTSSEEPRIESAAMCKMCSALFPNKDTLDEHLASTFTCLKCAIHHASEEELQEHYQRESKLHPKCKDCGLALADSPTWAQHRAQCPPDPSLLEKAEETLTSAHARDDYIEDAAHAPADSKQGKSTALLYPCRMCRSDPCLEPVLTICGHVFCRTCILKEMVSSTCCPVCQKTFFVRL